MNNITPEEQWSENVVIVDGDYVDRVAFDLTVNFERMLERRIPKADMARWLDCVVLDGGLREGDNTIQVVLLHDKSNARLENFEPADYEKELDGKAFKDSLGEFVLNSFAVEKLRSKEDHLLDILELVCQQPKVKRVMIVPDAENMYDPVRHALRNVSDEKRVTIFAMQPMAGGNFRQEILGYSLMQALGIRGEELNKL